MGPWPIIASRSARGHVINEESEMRRRLVLFFPELTMLFR